MSDDLSAGYRLLHQVRQEIHAELKNSEPEPKPIPGWMRPKGRILVQKGEVAPEKTRPGTRIIPPTPRGQGPRKTWQAT